MCLSDVGGYAFKSRCPSAFARSIQSYQIISCCLTILHLPPPRSPHSYSFIVAKMRLPAVTDVLNPISPLANLSLSAPHRVLVVGCAYGGISVVTNLLACDKGKGMGESYVPEPVDLKSKRSKRGVDITVLDQRDGYCTLSPQTKATIHSMEC